MPNILRKGQKMCDLDFLLAAMYDLGYYSPCESLNTTTIGLLQCMSG